MHKVPLLPRRATQNLPQPVRLDIIIITDLPKHRRDRLARPRLVRRRGAHYVRSVSKRFVRGRVARVGTVVPIHDHCAIALKWVECIQGPVDRDLGIVDPEPVTVGIRVGEEPRLEDRVGRGFDAWHQMRGGEGDLLHLGKVILRVAVQGELAHGSQGDLALRPYFGQVEDVPPELLGLLRRQRLDVDRPARVLAALDRFEKILRVPVRVVGGHARGFFIGKGLVPLVRLEVDLHIDEGPIRFGELHRVARVAVHVPVRVRRAPVGEEVHHLVNALLVRAQIVPKHGGIFAVGLGVAFLRVDEDWEVHWVPKEEDRRVVEHPVIIALLCVELDGETCAHP